MTINERISALRQQMASAGIDAYIIPSSDPHQSEYVADCWKGREWISGFTGSAGTVVVTQNHAGLWTDSRYFLQAETQLAGSEMELHKLGIQGAAEYLDWICSQLSEGQNIGIDGSLFSTSMVRAYKRQLKKNKMTLHSNLDLLDPVWTDRPALPAEKIFEHALHHAGTSRADKLASVRQKMASAKVQYHLVTTLDDIAWMFNIRGRDVECNPVAIAFAVVGMDQSWLFVDMAKIDQSLGQNLAVDQIHVMAYDEVGTFIQSLPEDAPILVDPSTTNFSLFAMMSKHTVVEGKTIPLYLKAIKTDAEISHIRNAMIKDGVALLRLFRWLESRIADGQSGVSEYELSEKLAQCRGEQEGYYGESFHAIVGYKGNGAIIHYRPEKDTAATIRAEGILLLDSGGQYVDGTTDITRTVALSPPNAAAKKHFTLVLKGHIQLALAVFPTGTMGVQLDILARKPLWEAGLNYGHGTGHGVGYFLNVHEPPQGFVHTLATRGVTVMEKGMFSSNEPGFYLEGQYGIRIENLVVCVEKERTEFGTFLAFDTLTLFPIDHQLIDKTLLSEAEIAWLNAYHREVEQKLAPHIQVDEREWLREKCREI